MCLRLTPAQTAETPLNWACTKGHTRIATLLQAADMFWSHARHRTVFAAMPQDMLRTAVLAGTGQARRGELAPLPPEIWTCVFAFLRGRHLLAG
jgi:hypothetical protein